MGEYEEAIKYILIGIEHQQDGDLCNGWAHFYLALVYNVTGKHQDAEESFKKAVGIIKTDKDLLAIHLKGIKSVNESNKEIYERLKQLVPLILKDVA